MCSAFFHASQVPAGINTVRVTVVSCAYHRTRECSNIRQLGSARRLRTAGYGRVSVRWEAFTQIARGTVIVGQDCRSHERVSLQILAKAGHHPSRVIVKVWESCISQILQGPIALLRFALAWGCTSGSFSPHRHRRRMRTLLID